MLLADLRQAARQLRASRGYTTAVVLTFACAIAASTAIFSAVNAVLLRPLPVRDPGQLHVVWQTDEGGQAVVELTHRHLREWREHGSVFRDAAVMGSHTWSAVLEGRGDPSRIFFAGVSAGFFDVMGVQPMLGRGLRPEDDVPTARAVAVLNYAAWVRRFGADPSVVGTSMTLDGDKVEIVGVMPPDLDVPRGAEFWVPVVPVLASGTPSQTTALDRVGIFYVLGRTAAPASSAEVATALNALEARLDASITGRLRWGTRAVVTPFMDHVFGPVRRALTVLWIAVGVLLLIACANVSGLMLTRISRRRQQDAIRRAVGASPWAVSRLWMAEMLLLAAAGGAAGLLLGHALTAAVVALAPDDLPRLTDIRVDLRVSLFAFGCVMAAALVSSLVPLRGVRRTPALLVLEGERLTASRGSVRWRTGLVVLQIALAVVLLVGAGLVVRSFRALTSVELGFTSDRVLSLTVQPRGANRPPNEFLHEFLERVRAVPGVESAGAVFLRPLMLGPIGQGARVVLEGPSETQASADRNPTLNYQIATAGYFETLKIPLRAGRLFTDHDRTGTERVAIVSESTARRLWPGQDPIGRKLAMSAFTPGSKGLVWRRIVGVVSDVRYRALDEVQLDVYDPALQTGRPADNVLIRTAGDSMRAAAAVAALAREMDSTAIVDNITTLDRVVQRAEAP